jgi:hypothetical protein
MGAAWREVRSERDITNDADTIIVRGIAPYVTINTTLHTDAGRSMTCKTSGPFATLEEARAEAEAIAARHGIDTIHLIDPVGSQRAANT